MGKLQVDVIKKCLDEASKGCLQTADEPPPSPIFHWEFGICSFLSQVRSLRLRWLFVQVAQLEKDKVTWVPQLSLDPLLSLLRSLTEVTFLVIIS